jgi:hypothetical protein
MEQNSAITWIWFLSKLLQRGGLKVYETAPNIAVLDRLTTSMFLCGREDDNPFIAVPSDFMPFFCEVDWNRASIFRKEGILFLESRDPVDDDLNFALGFSARPKRLDVFAIKDTSDIYNKRLSIKVFELNDDGGVVLMENDVLMNIPLNEIDSMDELYLEENLGDTELLKDSGLDSRFVLVKPIVK